MHLAEELHDGGATRPSTHPFPPHPCYPVHRPPLNNPTSAARIPILSVKKSFPFPEQSPQTPKLSP